MILDNIVFFNAGVDRGHLFERLNHGFNEKRHKPKLHAMFCDEVLLDLFAKLHHGRHISLVKGGQNGRSLLGVDEVLGNFAPQRRHFSPSKAAFLS